MPGQRKGAFALQVASAARKLGAKADLIGHLASYGDTLEAEDVLVILRKWNDRRGSFAKNRRQSRPDLEDKLVQEMLIALESLGASKEILAIINRWGRDEDEVVITDLQSAVRGIASAA